MKPNIIIEVHKIEEEEVIEDIKAEEGCKVDIEEEDQRMLYIEEA